MSLGPSGLVVAGSTIPIRSTTSEGLGGVILAGFGPSTTAAVNGASTGTSTTATGPGTGTTPGVVGFQGGATRLGSWGARILLGSMLAAGGWIVVFTVGFWGG